MGIILATQDASVCVRGKKRLGVSCHFNKTQAKSLPGLLNVYKYIISGNF